MSEESLSQEPTEASSAPEVTEEATGEEIAAAESTQDLQDAVEGAIANGASDKEVKNLIKEFQLKVNGKTVNKTIDLSDENALRNELQLSAAARQAMQEASNLKKLYEQEVSRLRKNPWQVLEELGLNPDEMAELRIQQRIEEMKKSPEQLEREKIELEKVQKGQKRPKVEIFGILESTGVPCHMESKKLGSHPMNFHI
jgi:hypothetical protein